MSEVSLNESNYYSLEMAQKYCSASQYKNFIGYPLSKVCEQRAMAELRGEWKQETTKALLIGSILDALWDGSTPEQMLAYRASAFFARIYAPNELMGYRVEGEAEDLAKPEKSKAVDVMAGE